jgi:signal transduction histidine kinase
MRDTIRQAAAGSRYLLSGGLTALGAGLAFSLIGMMIGSNLVAGPIILPVVIMTDRWIAGIERRRAQRLLGGPVEAHYRPLSLPDDPPGWRGAVYRWLVIIPRGLADRTTYTDLVWVMAHTLVGAIFAAAVLAMAGWLVAVVGLPLWWWLAGNGAIASWWPRVLALAPGVLVVALWVVPLLATAEARLAAALLGPPRRHRLATRVAELTRSRAEALDAHSAELRRIERDLHDGAQAQMVSVALLLGVAEHRFADDPAAAAGLVTQAREGAEVALCELRGLVRGMYPPILADRGLEGAIEALAGHGRVPVSVEARSIGRLPAAVESAAYFVVAEALTNVARHSQARHATVSLRREGRMLTIMVGDDGTGGADESLGTGLLGIRRRATALDGRMRLHSPPAGPTSLIVELPCES